MGSSVWTGWPLISFQEMRSNQSDWALRAEPIVILVDTKSGLNEVGPDLCLENVLAPRKRSMRHGSQATPDRGASSLTGSQYTSLQVSQTSKHMNSVNAWKLRTWKLVSVDQEWLGPDSMSFTHESCGPIITCSTDIFLSRLSPSARTSALRRSRGRA